MTEQSEINTNDLNINELNADDIDDIIFDVTLKKKTNVKVVKQQKKLLSEIKNYTLDKKTQNDDNIIKNSKTSNITNNDIKLMKEDIDDLDEEKEYDNYNNETQIPILNEQESKIISGKVYGDINDKYYQDLSNYDINKHGIGNSPIITEIKNVNTQRKIKNDSISDFYGHDYKHLCHPNNKLYDLEILKGLSNDYEFEYDYRDIGNYDEIINKYLHIDLINYDKHKKNLVKIISILNNDLIKFDKKKLIIYYNEWLLNNNWMLLNNNVIVNKFINAYKQFIYKYKLLFNKKIYDEQKKVNTTDYNVSVSSVFYESNLNESHSLKSNNASRNYMNKEYFQNRPSAKYNTAPIIPFTYSSVFY